MEELLTTAYIKTDSAYETDRFSWIFWQIFCITFSGEVC